MYNKCHERMKFCILSNLKKIAMMSILLPWKMLFYKPEVP